MNFIDSIQENAKKNRSLVCLGLDPQIEKIPIPEKSVEKKITVFFEKILDACVSANALPNVVKPNYAFFAQYGFDGFRALEKTIAKAHSLNLPVILDAKRNDIGKTAEAYARECFEFWKVDAVTVNPFMGTDSIEPFLKWCREKEKGIFVLNRTSNPGASDFQTQKMHSQKQLFEAVSEKIAEWGMECHGNVGAVVGATSPGELGSIAHFFVQHRPIVPLLIPGVGTQGGSAEETVSILKKNRYLLETVVINSSSGVLYAHEKQPGIPFEEASLKAIKELRRQTIF